MLLGAGSRACLKKALTSYKQNRDLRAWHKHTILLFTITIKILVGSHEFCHCKVTDPTESLSTISTQVLPRFSWISWPLES